MPSVERIVSCSECGTERSTRAGTGTTLKCSKGHVFKAPAPTAEPAPLAPAAPRVKRATAAQTVVRQNARPRPKKVTSAAPGSSPAPSEDVPAPASGGGAASAPPPLEPAPKNPPGGDPPEQVKFGRRGGLGYYQRLVRKTAA